MDSIIPFEGEGVFKESYAEGWNEIENFERYLDHNSPEIEDFYGFEKLELAIDQGASVSGLQLL